MGASTAGDNSALEMLAWKPSADRAKRRKADKPAWHNFTRDAYKESGAKKPEARICDCCNKECSGCVSPNATASHPMPPRCPHSLFVSLGLENVRKRIIMKLENVGWRMPVLDWAAAREVAAERQRRRDAGEPEIGSYMDMLTSEYGQMRAEETALAE